MLKDDTKTVHAVSKDQDRKNAFKKKIIDKMQEETVFYNEQVK